MKTKLAKISLIQVKIFDGEHEHYKHALFHGTEKQAERWATKRNLEDYWGYGDDTTGQTFQYAQEITAEQAQVLTDLNVVHFIN